MSLASLAGARIPHASAGDPLFGNVVLLLQGGTLQDFSSYNRTVTSSSATLNDTSYVVNGLNTIKLVSVFLGANGFLTWARSAELEFGTSDFCIEGYFKVANVPNFNFYIDRIGGGGDPLGWAPNQASNPAAQSLAINGASATGVGPSLLLPASFYACIERVGDQICGSIDGINGSTPKTLTPGLALNAATIDARIGLGSAQTNTWTDNVGQYRITIGANRYNGANFTPPTAPYPTF